MSHSGRHRRLQSGRAGGAGPGDAGEVQFSGPGQHLLVSLYFNSSGRCVTVSRHGLICISLVASDVDCLLACLSATLTSYLVKRLVLSFAHFLVRVCVFYFEF